MSRDGLSVRSTCIAWSVICEICEGSMPLDVEILPRLGCLHPPDTTVQTSVVCGLKRLWRIAHSGAATVLCFPMCCM